MALTEGSPRGKRADGWWYPWIFVGAMALVVVVNGIMVAIALGTWTGLETEGHYQKGLEYNRNLAAAEAQAALGWTLTLEAAPIARDDKRRTVDLRLAFADRDGRPLDGMKVSVVLMRATNEGFDREVHLDPIGDGIYGARAVLPLPGQWEVRVLARRGETEFQDLKRLVLP